jgi:hypothetical protein
LGLTFREGGRLGRVSGCGVPAGVVPGRVGWPGVPGLGWSGQRAWFAGRVRAGCPRWPGR